MTYILPEDEQTAKNRLRLTYPDAYDEDLWNRARKTFRKIGDRDLNLWNELVRFSAANDVVIVTNPNGHLYLFKDDNPFWNIHTTGDHTRFGYSHTCEDGSIQFCSRPAGEIASFMRSLSKAAAAITVSERPAKIPRRGRPPQLAPDRATG